MFWQVFYDICHTKMKQMDPEPGASSAFEMERGRVPAQSSLLLAVTEKLPVLRLGGESKKDADKRAIHVFPSDRVLQPAPSYEEYEDVPKAEGSARSTKRIRLSSADSPPGMGSSTRPTTGGHFGKVRICYVSEHLAYVSWFLSFCQFLVCQTDLAFCLCARSLLTRLVTLTAMAGGSLPFTISCSAPLP
jgi:hypothetical protein